MRQLLHLASRVSPLFVHMLVLFAPLTLCLPFRCTLGDILPTAESRSAQDSDATVRRYRDFQASYLHEAALTTFSLFLTNLAYAKSLPTASASAVQPHGVDSDKFLVKGRYPCSFSQMKALGPFLLQRTRTALAKVLACHADDLPALVDSSGQPATIYDDLQNFTAGYNMVTANPSIRPNTTAFDQRLERLLKPDPKTTKQQRHRGMRALEREIADLTELMMALCT